MIQLSYKWNIGIKRVSMLTMEHLELTVNSNDGRNPAVRVASVHNFKQSQLKVVSCSFIIEMTTVVCLHDSQYNDSLLHLSNTVPQSNTNASTFFNDSITLIMSECNSTSSALRIGLVQQNNANSTSFRGSPFATEFDDFAIGLHITGYVNFFLDIHNVSFYSSLLSVIHDELETDHEKISKLSHFEINFQNSNMHTTFVDFSRLFNFFTFFSMEGCYLQYTTVVLELDSRNIGLNINSTNLLFKNNTFI